MAEEVNEPTEETRPAEAEGVLDETGTKNKRIFFSFWLADDVGRHWEQPTSYLKSRLIHFAAYPSGNEIEMALSGSEEKRTPEEETVSAIINGALADVERTRQATARELAETARLRDETRAILSKLMAA